jgi:oligopeptide transport system substrate-binding protein
MIRLRLFSASTLLLVTLALACSGSEDGPTAKAPPGLGDELRLALDSEPSTLDPQLALLTPDLSVTRQVFRGLFWYDEDMNLVPMIARELPSTKNSGLSDDGLVYRIKLRDDVKWSDGLPVSAADFEFALKRLLDPTLQAPAAANYFDITGAEAYGTCFDCSEEELAALRDDVGIRAEDAATLVITLRVPRSTFPHLLASVVASPARRDAIEANPSTWMDPENLISVGPFVIQSWVRGQSIVLEPNPFWWGEGLELKRVTIKIIPDPVEAYNAYLAGELEAVVVPPELVATVSSDPNLSTESLQLTSFASIIYFLDNAAPPFDDPAVRQAVSLAIDREAFILDTNAPAIPGYNLLPPEMPGHQAELGKQWRFDPAKAREVLAAAGYASPADVPAVEYAYAEGNARAEAAARFLKEQLATNLGVSVNLQPISLDEWRERLFGGQLQVILIGVSAEYGDAEALLRDLWTCQNYEGTTCTAFAGANFSHYSNPDFDRLMQQAAKESDTRRRLALYGDAEELLVDDAAGIFVGYETRLLLVKGYVGGVTTLPIDWLPSELLLDRVYINR